MKKLKKIKTPLPKLKKESKIKTNDGGLVWAG